MKNHNIPSTVGRFSRYAAYVAGLSAVVLVGWLVIPATVNYHLTERYVFTSAQQDASLRLAVILPESGPYQQVENMHIDWSGGQERETVPALNAQKFEGTIRAGETREAVISYDVTLWQGPAVWAAPVLDAQTEPQPEIESGQAVLVHQAAQIAPGRTRADAYAIHAFTSAYLSWPKGDRIGADQSALTAYTTRVGGCGDFANLFVALSRAAKIPAQAITGLALPAYPPFWTDTQTWNHPGGAHAWVEVYTGANWEMADPSWASYAPSIFKAVWFGRNDGSHLSYGESGQYARLYADLTAWAEQSGKLIGGMSNPLHFVSAANVDSVVVEPSVTLKKGWDGRWVVTGGGFLVAVIGLRLLENRFRKAARPQPAPESPRKERETVGDTRG
jgi:hypothetical protein